MANSTVGINFTITQGANGLQRLVVDANSLRSALSETLQITREIASSRPLNFAVFATGFKNVSDSLNAVSSVVSSLTSESGSFSSAMKAANTMAGKGAEDFARLKDQVSGLSKEVPMARDALANGLYQTISSGVPEDNWIEFLRTSARSATGGIADLNKVVGVTATVVKNYGMSWDDAADIQDKIQLTAKNGVTSFEQLAEALPKVTGNAATLGVSIDELMASFATLTGVSGNTAEVSTQLGAIFSALVKPTTEASKMAAEMGIQFDASAIQAAGGLEAFLQTLDSSVKAYSEMSGVLEQEVYGKLFGSAESLRALVPLQGELASKFSENIATMADSAGTMDQAYSEMASTGSASTQILKNKWADLTDGITSMAAKIAPLLNFAAPLLTSASSVVTLVQSLKGLNVVTALATAKTSALKVANLLWSRTAVTTSAITRSLTAAFHGTAVGATTAKVAIQGLLISTGVGAAIVGLTMVLEAFMVKTDEVAETVEKLDDGTDDYTRTAAEAKVKIDADIKALGELVKSGKESADMVDRLNESYGDLFGSQKTCADWYDTLSKKSAEYTRRMGLEAQARTLNSQIAELAVKRELAAEKLRDNQEKLSEHQEERKKLPWYKKLAPDLAGKIYEYSVKTYQEQIDDIDADTKTLQSMLDKTTGSLEKLASSGKESAAALKVNEMNMDQVTAAMERNETARKKLTSGKGEEAKKLLAEKAQLEARKKVLEKELQLDKKSAKSNKGKNKRKIVANPTTKDELQTNIELTRKKLTGAATDTEKQMLRNIRLWEEQLDVIKMTEAEFSRPASLDTLRQIDEELQYQQQLRMRSSQEYIAAVDTEIKSLEDLRRAIEEAGFIPLPIEQINSYEQLEEQLSHYQDQLRHAGAEERETIQLTINTLEDLRTKWDEILADLKKPAELPMLRTIEDIDKALSYYNTKLSKASGDEVGQIQRTINALEKKRAALMRGADLVNLRRDADEIEKLTGKDYKIKVKSMDVDTLTGQIRDLQRMLADTENPVTDDQRKSIEDLIGVYSKWRREAYDTAGAISSAWGEIKNLKGAVSSIMSGFDAEASVWERLTGLVDGFVAAFDGVRGVIALITQMSEAMGALNAVRKAGTAATEADTVATAANTIETSVNTAEAAANTAVKSGEAVAEATASGAKLPFPANLAAIASGLSAVMGALMFVGKFATGGIVGGNSPSGDRLFARVNSGEMILNMTQQRRLFDFLNGAGSLRGVSAPQLTRVNPTAADLRGLLREPSGGGQGGTVRFTIEGRTLVGVLANETRIAGKSGRRTNIIL